jgi:thiol-disulfide isomerase/thioredoxin
MAPSRRRLLSLVLIGGLIVASAVASLAWPRLAWERAYFAAVEQERQGEPFDVAALADRLDAYLDSSPEPKPARLALRDYFSLLETVDAHETHLRALLSHPNQQIGAMAQAHLRRRALLGAPVQLRFTALDGREVNLQDLRGKVVLLEFWATWCSTCLRELPTLRAVHEKYRDEGFEIVGIALDEARDKDRLLAILQKENVAWPQYLPGDGHYATSEISRQFGVVGIPTTFLLNRRGMIVETNLRGERLEAAVRNLLGEAITISAEQESVLLAATADAKTDDEVEYSP